MKRHEKHIKVYDDITQLYKQYFRCHQHLPKPFRFTTGERILHDIAYCLKTVSRVNHLMKHHDPRLPDLLNDAMASLDVVHAYLSIAWELTWLSHGQLVELSNRIAQIQKQLYGWRRWHLAKAST
ncbi:four helix bundle protein [Vibrio sp. F13]|uniref:four helix bundle protein n=1 Tax=Vibrio sp. F13 TaxID=2070777 RepID=UPI0010BDDF9E|nr:four helix bundle protein [Vibrio sp. F13]TKG06072.1 four helix bundle protein [Vibrio sp. F13]